MLLVKYPTWQSFLLSSYLCPSTSESEVTSTIRPGRIIWPANHGNVVKGTIVVGAFQLMLKNFQSGPRKGAPSLEKYTTRCYSMYFHISDPCLLQSAMMQDARSAVPPQSRLIARLAYVSPTTSTGCKKRNPVPPETVGTAHCHRVFRNHGVVDVDPHRTAF